MKKEFRKIIPVIVFCFGCFHVNAQKPDTIATKIIEKHLKIIEDYLKNPLSGNAAVLAESVSFLTDVTDIPSQSLGNYLGQYSPKKEDFFLWDNWYKKNKEHIIWDNTLKLIIFCKKVKAPEFP